MKDYFLKYRPVDDPPVAGDVVTCIDFIYEPFVWSGDISEVLKKCELFLCTKNVEVGDKVGGEVDSYDLGVVTRIESDKHITWVEYDGEENDWISDSVYKVVGRVHPGAIGVKEYDEFTRAELEPYINVGAITLNI